MVKSGQTPILTVAYRTPADAPFGVEVMSFAQLRARGPATYRAAPHRPQFHVLAIIEGGTGHHTADFARHVLRAGSVIWIRPGQVHQLDGVEHVDGTLVLFQPDFLAPGTLAHAAAEDVFGSQGWELAERYKYLASLALDHLRAEYTRGAGDSLPDRVDVLRSLLGVLILRVLSGAEHKVRPSSAEDVFVRFREAVEQNFAEQHRVSWYARRLGYSPKTLTRASLADAGTGAKEFIDRRVVLEAKRLLAHGDLTIAQCGSALGFDDTANFGRYFADRVGLTPGAFRVSVRSLERSAPPAVAR
jgi:AraC-like DNA-binding protein